MRHFVFVFLAAAFLSLPAPASAGEAVACGAPASVTMSTEAQDYCNLHQRRFAYREENTKLRGQMDERRENYYAPQSSGIKSYEAELEALNEGRGGTAADPSESSGELDLSPQ